MIAKGLAFVLAALGRAPAGLASTTAVPDDVPPALRRLPLARSRWVAQHERYVERAAEGRIDALLLGDSLTYGWMTDGRAVFAEVYASRGVVPFGIGGDRTADLLWRIRHGEIGASRPRIVVVLIGTNDLGAGADARAIVGGVTACVDAVRERLPAAEILVLGLLPRGPGGANESDRETILAVNEALSTLARRPHVRFADLGDGFLLEDGTLEPAAYHADLLHLSAIGYAIWARRMEPFLEPYLSSKT